MVNLTAFSSVRRSLPTLLGGLVLAVAAGTSAQAQTGPISVTDPSRFPGPPTLAISDVTAREPLSDPERPIAGPSQVPARFIVKLTRPHSGPVSVAYRTVDGAAKAGSDYTARSGVVTIAAGATSVPIDVMVRADRAVEPNESFFVELTGVTNVIGIPIADGRGAGTILDNTF
jgi:chitinase